MTVSIVPVLEYSEWIFEYPRTPHKKATSYWYIYKYMIHFTHNKELYTRRNIQMPYFFCVLRQQMFITWGSNHIHLAISISHNQLLISSYTVQKQMVLYSSVTHNLIMITRISYAAWPTNTHPWFTATHHKNTRNTFDDLLHIWGVDDIQYTYLSIHRIQWTNVEISGHVSIETWNLVINTWV